MESEKPRKVVQKTYRELLDEKRMESGLHYLEGILKTLKKIADCSMKRGWKVEALEQLYHIVRVHLLDEKRMESHLNNRVSGCGEVSLLDEKRMERYLFEQKIKPEKIELLDEKRMERESKVT